MRFHGARAYKGLVNAIKEILSDTDGSLSFVRVAVLLIIGAFLFNWCYLTAKTGQAQTLDWSSVAVVLGSLGIKVAQKPFENKPTETPAAPVQPQTPKV